MRNTKIHTLLFAFLGVILFTSCEDKIDVELDDAEAIVVIDAFLTDVPGAAQEITVTRSQSYFDSSFPEPITDAFVSISVGSDILINFEYIDGKYIWQPNSGESLADFAQPYVLNVQLGDVVYSATDSLKRTPQIDEIRQEVREDEIGSVDGGIYCEVIARDELGKGDTYWIKTFKNGVFLNRPEEINLAFDGGFDQGAQSDGLIFIPPIRELVNPFPDSTEVADDISPWAVGDQCRVEIHSISNSTFAFLEIVRDQLLNGQNGIFAEPLANAPSNISASDGSTVLGAFNVAKVSSLEVVIE